MRLAHVTENQSFDLDEAKIFINMRIKPEQFDPVLSAASVDLHFNTLTKGYFKKWNEQRTDFAFCGAALHSIWWAGLAKEPVTPSASVVQFLDTLGLSVDTLTDKFIEQLDELHGSGWFYLDRNGQVQIIENHSYDGDFSNILVLIDLWEHSYILDYKADKKAYLTKIMTLVDWKEVGKRLTDAQYTQRVLRISKPSQPQQ